jgi:acylphosphatase
MTIAIQAKRRWRKPPHPKSAISSTRSAGWVTVAQRMERRMRLALDPIVLMFVGGLVCGAAVLTAGAASAEQHAIKGIVSGEAIQKVGFRAMIQKQAIMTNLAGYARNVPDGTVSISLQGDKDRIDKVLGAIRAGSKKSSTGNKVSVTEDALDPSLKTFTVFAWTSTTRNITNPYDLVFQLRPADDEISKKGASAAWNSIAESTLKGDDLAKFMKHLDADD